MTSVVILHYMKNLCTHNLNKIDFHQDMFINECAKTNLAKISEGRTERRSFLRNVGELTFVQNIVSKEQNLPPFEQ